MTVLIGNKMAGVDAQYQYQRELEKTRRLLIGKPKKSEDGEDKDEIDDLDIENQNAARRHIEELKQRARQRLLNSGQESTQRLAEEKVKKEIAQKVGWRSVKIAMGATVLLAILTVLIWTVQFIGGNIMGVKWMPKLDIGEIILWLVALFIVFAAFSAIMILITILVQVYEDPIQAVLTFGSIILEVFWGVIKGVVTSLVTPG